MTGLSLGTPLADFLLLPGQTHFVRQGVRVPINRYQPKRHAPKPYWLIWLLGSLAILTYAISFFWPPSFILGFLLTIACGLVNWGLSTPGPNVPMPPG